MEKLKEIMKENLTKEEIDQQDEFLDGFIKELVSVAESNNERTLYVPDVFEFVVQILNENYAMYIILKLRELGINISFEEEGIETLNAEDDLLLGNYIYMAATIVHEHLDEIINLRKERGN